MQLFEQKSYASLISVCILDWPINKTFFQKASSEGIPIFGWDSIGPKADKSLTAFRPNGLIYLFRKKHFFQTKCIYAEPMGLFKVSALESADVDYEFQLTYANLLFSQIDKK